MIRGNTIVALQAALDSLGVASLAVTRSRADKIRATPAMFHAVVGAADCKTYAGSDTSLQKAINAALRELQAAKEQNGSA